MSVPALRRLAAVLSVVPLLLLPSDRATAQSSGAPRSGLRLSFQPAFTFARFVADDTEGVANPESYSARRGNSLTVRASYLLLHAVSGYVEVGSSQRGSIIRAGAGGADELEVRANWWDLGGGLNVALRCVGYVCPSVDVGGVIARSREAILREGATGRPLGTVPLARYESSASAGIRLLVPRIRGMALVLRHQEGLTNLARDGGVAFRSRAQILQLAIPLTME